MAPPRRALIPAPFKAAGCFFVGLFDCWCHVLGFRHPPWRFNPLIIDQKASAQRLQLETSPEHHLSMSSLWTLLSSAFWHSFNLNPCQKIDPHQSANFGASMHILQAENDPLIGQLIQDLNIEDKRIWVCPSTVNSAPRPDGAFQMLYSVNARFEGVTGNPTDCSQCL
jgi:hypothetical protein